MNKEELERLLKSRGFTVESFIATRGNKEPEVCAKPIKSGIFELVMAAYPDFAILKKTAEPELLVIMPSLNKFFIKKTTKQRTIIKKLTKESYVAFFQGLKSSIKMPENFWINEIRGTNLFIPIISGDIIDNIETYHTSTHRHDWDMYFTFIHKYPDVFDDSKDFSMSESFRNAIKDKVIRLKLSDKLVNIEQVSSNYKLYNVCPALYKYVIASNKANTLFGYNIETYKWLINSFGIDNVKDFISELELSLVDFDRYSIRFPDYPFKYAAFKDYVLYESVTMGYARSFSVFVDTWNDALEMQKKIDAYAKTTLNPELKEVYRGKIHDKYPKDLPLLHNKLQYKMNMLQQEIDDLEFAKLANDYEEYEYETSKYLFIVPHTKDKFLDEALQQANCLASYVDKYLKRSSLIVFMRDVDAPETSLVSIELDPKTFEIRQRYQKRNTATTAEQNIWINEFVMHLQTPDIKTTHKFTRIMDKEINKTA